MNYFFLNKFSRFYLLLVLFLYAKTPTLRQLTELENIVGSLPSKLDRLN